MKALVGTFNQKKALVGAFSVIVKTKPIVKPKTDGSFYSTSLRYVEVVEAVGRGEDVGRGDDGAAALPRPANQRGALGHVTRGRALIGQLLTCRARPP